MRQAECGKGVVEVIDPAAAILDSAGQQAADHALDFAFAGGGHGRWREGASSGLVGAWCAGTGCGWGFAAGLAGAAEIRRQAGAGEGVGRLDAGGGAAGDQHGGGKCQQAGGKIQKSHGMKRRVRCM